MIEREARGRMRLYATCLATSVIMAGCLDGGGGSSSASAVPGKPSASGNSAPVISGTAATSTAVGNTFAFAPSSADVDGDKLSFSIDNKPVWASFDASTGRLSGTPGAADIGSYAGIAIRVSDGTSTASLPAFTITVTQIGTGSATLSWLPPTAYSDGKPLVDLAGYYIYYGTAAGNLDRVVKIDNASINRFQIDSLSAATWYFSVKAYTSAGLESEFSPLASKKIS
ncbi:MAG: putative Ig domain-containing protein [Steroidobacteraceae bacterium]